MNWKNRAPYTGLIVENKATKDSPAAAVQFAIAGIRPEY
jgi:hypothetical protein